MRHKNSENNCGDWDVYRRVAGTPKAVTSYTTATSASNCAGWTFAGSEDGVVWDDLDSYARAPNGVTEALNMTSGEIENATVCLPADRKGNGAAQTVTRTIEGASTATTAGSSTRGTSWRCSRRRSTTATSCKCTT